MKKTIMLLSFLLIIGSLLIAACQPAQPEASEAPITPPPPAVCPIQPGTTSNDPDLQLLAISKQGVPRVADEPFPVLTVEQWFDYFDIEGVPTTALVVDSDCVTLQLEPVVVANGFLPYNACNPTNRRYDGWKSAYQPGFTLTFDRQKGFETGNWLMEAMSWAPNPDNSPILAVLGACP